MLFGTMVAVLALIAVPAIANAGVDATSKLYTSYGSCDQNGLRMVSHFRHQGDRFVAKDRCTDGWGANTEWLVSRPSGGTWYGNCYNGSGDGTKKVCKRAWLAEGRYGQILSISTDNGVFKDSGPVVSLIT